MLLIFQLTKTNDRELCCFLLGQKGTAEYFFRIPKLWQLYVIQNSCGFCLRVLFYISEENDCQTIILKGINCLKKRSYCYYSKKYY